MAIPVCQTMKELASFFHDRQVCTEIRIENIVNSYLFQGTYQFALRCIPVTQTDLFSPCSSDSRCNLNHSNNVRIFQCIVETSSVISFPKCTYRAVSNTLSTESTFTLIKFLAAT